MPADSSSTAAITSSASIPAGGEPAGPVVRQRIVGLGILDLAILAALVVATSVWLCDLAMAHFDFFDMSAFLDAGWRVACGQRPFVDFSYNAGPVHLYLHALFFKIFGFTKTAVLAHLFTLNAIGVIEVYILARRKSETSDAPRLGRAAAAVLAVLTSVTLCGTIAHPWYDITASVFLLSAAFVYDLLRPGAGWRGAWGAALCGALIACSFLCKANVGIAGAGLLAMLIAATAIRERSIAGLAGYVAGGLIGFVLAFVPIGVGTIRLFIYQAFLAYNVEGRFSDTFKLQLVLLTLPYIWLGVACVAFSLLGGKAFARQHTTERLLALGFAATGAFGAWTGSMVIPPNILLVGPSALYVWVIARALPMPADHLRRMAVLFARVMPWPAAAALLFLGYQQRGATWDWKGSNTLSDYAMITPSFAGWHAYPGYGEGVDRAVREINSRVPRTDSLMVFPDATVIYGLTGRVSWPDAPFIYHVRVWPPPGPMEEHFHDRFLKSPPKWILIHWQKEITFYNTDRLLIWLGIDDYIAGHYQPVWQWSAPGSDAPDFQLLQRIKD